MIKSEKVNYFLDDLPLNGFLSYDDTIEEKQPCVLIAPTWMGLTPFIREKTEAVAKLGYLAFGIDFFGEGAEAKDPLEAKKWITPLLENRQILRDRMYAALNFIRTHPKADHERIAAIGFCFGGGAVIELAKAGANIRGVVSFHGVLGNPHHIEMKPMEISQTIPASILLLHGYKDPFAPEEDLLQFEKEMSARGVDWQAVIYGEAMHAFTNPKVNVPESGLQYHEKSAKRSWQAMKNFLEEIF